MIEEKIKSIKNNLFYRSRNAIKDYNTFDWHRNKKGIVDTDNVNSSQALAIDFWGCIKTSEYKDEIINMLFKKNESNWDILFEYEDKSLLNEKKSTQIDILLKASKTAIFIESKFTEKRGGKCSQTDKTKKGLTQCSGNYEKQTNPINNIEDKCSLSGKKIKYWEYIGKLTTLDKNATYIPCPIRNEEYQWIRNICFAGAYSEKYNIDVETILAYVDSPKCPIADKVKEETYLGELKGKLTKKENSLQPHSYNNLIDSIINTFDKNRENEKLVFIELKKWINNKEKLV